MNVPLVFHASTVQYLHHLTAIHRAMPDPPPFHVHPSLRQEAARHIPAAHLRVGLPRGRKMVGVVSSYVDSLHFAQCILVEHGSGQSYGNLRTGSYSGGPGRNHCVAFLVPSPRVADANLRTYPSTPNYVIGSPRVEYLRTLRNFPPTDPPTVAISFHWDGPHLLPELASAWHHYEPVFDKLAADPRFRLIGHGHPRAWSYLSRVWERYGIEPVEGFDEVVARASLYACDNSSTIWEAAACGLSVIVLDAPHLRNLSHGLRFGQPDLLPGPLCPDPAALPDLIADTLAHPSPRPHVTQAIFPTIDGAAALAADAILQAWGSVR